jgi:hypothetical protein
MKILFEKANKFSNPVYRRKWLFTTGTHVLARWLEKTEYLRMGRRA